MYNRYQTTRKKTGYNFEDAMVSILKTVATVETASKEQDVYEGTDAFVDRVRTDFTLYFDGKRYTQKIGTWGEFMFGVRIGNGKKRFNEPVLVIGLNIDPLSARQFIIPDVKDKIGNVGVFIEIAFNLYWQWMDNHPEYEL